MHDLDRVNHPVLGAGTVLRVLDGGRRCQVRFDGRSAPWTMSVDELGGSAATRVAVEIPETTASRADALQALEALRLGVVPRMAVTTLTVGRSRELASITEMLERGTGLRVVRGGYGHGKTHTADLAEATALQRGWVVARATFDPVDITPAHPVRLWGELVRNLSYPDHLGGGLLPLLERLEPDRPHLFGERSQRWLSAALFAAHHAPPQLADEVLAFVGGQERADNNELGRRLCRRGYRGAAMLALPDWRTYGQVVANLLGALAGWAKDAGWQGLLVILDEAEYLDRLGSVSREMAENLLRFVAMATLRREELAFEPASVRRGGHPVHRRIPARWRPDQPLTAICTFTPNPEIERVLARVIEGDSHVLDLEPPRGSEAGVLGARVLALVRRAWPEFDPSEEQTTEVHQALVQAAHWGELESARDVVRTAVAIWDARRHG